MPPVPVFEQTKVISLFRILAYLTLCAIGFYLIYAIRSLIPPFLVATIITMTLIPEVDRIERNGRSRLFAIFSVYLLFLLLGGLFLVVLIPQISGQMSGLISHLIQVIHVPNQADATQWMRAHKIPQVMHPAILSQIQQFPELISRAVQWFKDSIPNWAQTAVWIVIVPIIAFSMLLDFHKILGKMLLLAPKEKRLDILNVITAIIAVFGNYVRGVLTVMAMDIVVIAVVLYLFGLKEYALTLAVTAGILYTIPYFGALVSTIAIGLVTLLTQGLVPAIIVTIIMIVIHQVVFDNIVAPRVIGGHVNLHPLMTLFALMAGGTIFGIGGTLLAVPIAAAIQIIIVQIFPQFNTDTVTAQRAEQVVKTTLASDNEERKPLARQSKERKTVLKNEENEAIATQNATPILPPDKAEEASG